MRPNALEIRLMSSDVVRIRKNWADAVAAHDILGSIFYDQLFSIAPETRDMFPPQMDDQGRKLVQTLSWIVDHLDQPDQLYSAAKSLAIRHVGYGVAPSQYAAVGTALIATLESGLGDSFSAEDRAAWEHVYGDLSSKMINMAYESGD